MKKLAIAIMVLSSTLVWSKSQEIACIESGKSLKLTYEFEGDLLSKVHVQFQGELLTPGAAAGEALERKNLHPVHTLATSQFYGAALDKVDGPLVFRVVVAKNLLGRSFEKGRLATEIRLEMIHRIDFSADITSELAALVFKQLSTEGRLIEMTEFRSGCSSRIID